MWSLSLEWMLLALAVFWVVGAYNRLARLRSHCVQQFGALDACLDQWHAMLQEFEAQLPGADAQQPVQAQALAALHQAVQALHAALADARSRPLREAALSALEHACGALDAAWQEQVLGAGSGDPADAAGPLQPWQQRWTEQQMRNRLGLQQFNAAAERHNAAIGQYPAHLLSRLLGWQPVRSLQFEPAAPKAQESGT